MSDSVLPLFILEQKGAVWQPIEFVGTGFILGAPEREHDVLITCWHCVNHTISANQIYGGLLQGENGDPHTVIFLNSLEQDINGTDLACAIPIGAPKSPWRLGLKPTGTGNQVRSYGYPHTLGVRLSNGQKYFDLQERYLEGYVVREFGYKNFDSKIIPSYELDMLTPNGLSGGPIFDRMTGNVTGVVYGQHSVGSIVEEAWFDAETGERHPELQRLLHFGLAHWLPTLHKMQGSATGNLPLATFSPPE